MFRIKPSTQAVAVLATVAFVLLIVCGFTYYNRASKLRAMMAEVEQRQERLEDSTQIASRLSTVKQSYLDAEATLGVLEQGVSEKAYVPTFLRQLEDLGAKVNLGVAGVRPRVAPVAAAPTPDAEEDGAKAPEKKPYDELSIDIELHGQYWDVVRFLEEVTCFPKIVKVNDIQLSPVGQTMDLGSPTLNVRVNATAFILKESQAEVEADAGHRAAADDSRS